MTTITREDLKKMKADSIVRKNEEKINNYASYIKDKIIKNNENGDVRYVYNCDISSLVESKGIFEEVIERLKVIFVDMKMEFKKANGHYDTHLVFDWSDV